MVHLINIHLFLMFVNLNYVQGSVWNQAYVIHSSEERFLFSSKRVRHINVAQTNGMELELSVHMETAWCVLFRFTFKGVIHLAECAVYKALCGIKSVFFRS